MNVRRMFLPTILLLTVFVSTTHAAMLLGPLGGSGLMGEYSQFSDSPFSSVNFSYFYLEDFEDHLLNVPGVDVGIGGVSSVLGMTAIDSVDLDDGIRDGSGLNGDSYFSTPAVEGITFTFDASVLGLLPTHVGIVWTDGAYPTYFEAFGASGSSLGIIGPFDIGDDLIGGTTAEDRFFGAIDMGGISAIKILDTGGGIEVDHLQYGNAVPIPAAVWLLGSGLVGLVGLVGLRRKMNA